IIAETESPVRVGEISEQDLDRLLKDTCARGSQSLSAIWTLLRICRSNGPLVSRALTRWPGSRLPLPVFVRIALDQPTWTDPDLLEFAPYFFASLVKPEYLPVLPSYSFFRKLLHRRLGRQPVDQSDVEQEFLHAMLTKPVREIIRHPCQHPRLPGI